MRQIRREFHDPPKPKSAPAANSGIPTIASVDVVRRHYVITLGGMSRVDGHPDYDLRLQPVRDPWHYRLREIWIDAASFATDRLTAQGNFVSGGLTSVPWTVDFRQINGAPYVESERTDSTFTISRRTYDSAIVAFERLQSARIPPYAGSSAFSTDAQTTVPPLSEP